MTVAYPMILTPTLHVKVWGGRKLETVMNKTLFGDSPYGESWELHDQCTIGNGVQAGRNLSELIREFGTDIVGDKHDPAQGLPLLVKFLDASQWLSVQVHPNDAQAKALEGDPRGKTEAWVILASEPDARLVIGVQSGTTHEAVAEAIREGSLEDLLVYKNVQPGDVLYLPANTIHAIGPGILIYEVQQSSNMTYRLYDWNRVGLDGKPRDLHIEKGVQVSNLDSLPIMTHPTDELMVDGEYFQTWRYQIDGNKRELQTQGHFHSLTCIDGQLSIASHLQIVTIQKGQTVLIPAALAAYELDGEGTVLCSFML